MIRLPFATLALASLALIAAKPAGPVARDAWSRPAAAGTTAVGYLRLANPGSKPAVLVTVESPLATRGEMHNTSMVGGVMRMAAETRVEVPAHGEVAFAPGGRHLMFVGVKTALKPGDVLPATLVFADGRRVAARFAVGDGSGPPHGHAQPHS